MRQQCRYAPTKERQEHASPASPSAWCRLLPRSNICPRPRPRPPSRHQESGCRRRCYCVVPPRCLKAEHHYTAITYACVHICICTYSIFQNVHWNWNLIAKTNRLENLSSAYAQTKPAYYRLLQVEAVWSDTFHFLLDVVTCSLFHFIYRLM